MPFTISHPAIVLPLKVWRPQWFSLTGLIAGAMSPDLLYFLLLDTVNHGFSHSWPGLGLFCVPAGVLFAIVAQHLVKREFVSSLPHPLDRRLSGLAQASFGPVNGREWLVLVSSVLVGALSHFFWDSWTHPWGEIAKRIPWMFESTTVLGFSRPNCRYLQHLSTLAGGLVMLFFVLKSRLIPPPSSGAVAKRSGEKVRFWALGALASLAGGVAAMLLHGTLDPLVTSGLTYLRPSVTSFGLGSWAGLFYYLCLRGIMARCGSQKSHPD